MKKILMTSIISLVYLKKYSMPIFLSSLEIYSWPSSCFCITRFAFTINQRLRLLLKFSWVEVMVLFFPY